MHVGCVRACLGVTEYGVCVWGDGVFANMRVCVRVCEDTIRSSAVSVQTGDECVQHVYVHVHVCTGSLPPVDKVRLSGCRECREVNCSTKLAKYSACSKQKEAPPS